ncbi:MAG: hypothetical protein ACI8TE_001292, partial [Francisella sp.]
ENPNAQIYASHRFYEIGFDTKHIPIMINDEDELSYLKAVKNSGVKKYMMSYQDFIKKWNKSDDLNLIVIRNKHNRHLTKPDKALDDYRRDILSTKFHIVDSDSYATLVANNDVSI